MDEPLIAVRDLAVRFGAVSVLHDVDLAIRPREIVTIVGPNGSGKSTLLRTMLGAVEPTGGRVGRRENLRVGYVPQRLAIDATLPLSVARFLTLPARRARGEVERALALTGVETLGDRRLADLSGGQFQRVLLARALLGEPHLLMLDEPTRGLDQPATAAFYRLVENVRDETGAAVLMVSHDLHVVMGGSDRVVCLNGHVCCEGAPEVVQAAPAYRALFGEGTGGALALYRHHHDHTHDHSHEHAPDDAVTPPA